jgi:hypothetical protein
VKLPKEIQNILKGLATTRSTVKAHLKRKGIINSSSLAASDSRCGHSDDLDSVTSHRYLQSIERPKAESVVIVQKESSEAMTKQIERILPVRTRRNASINVVYPHMV